MTNISSTSRWTLMIMGAAIILAPSMAMAKKKKPDAAASVAPKVSLSFRNAMTAAQVAAPSGGAALKSRLNAAATAAQSADEKYYVGAYRYKQADTAGDRAEMLKGLEEMLGSRSPLIRDAAQMEAQAGGIAFEMFKLSEALDHMTKADKAGSKNVDRFLISAEVLAKWKRYPESLAMIDKAVASGDGKPVAGWYLRAMSIASSAKPPLSDEMGKWGGALGRLSPTSENWRTAAYDIKDHVNLPGPLALDLSRLVLDAKGLAGERDYMEFATLANANGGGADTKAAIEVGMAAGYVPRGSIAAKAALTAAASKSADSLLTTDPTKAAANYRAALKKGGVDIDLTNLRLGIALSRAGQKADAAKAFAAVGGAAKPVALLWAAFAETRP